MSQRIVSILLAGVCLAPIAGADEPKVAPATDELPRAAEAGTFNTESPTVEDLLHAWEAGASRLRSYEVYVSGEIRTLLDTENWKPREPPLVSRHSSHQFYLPDKRRFDGELPPNGPGQKPFPQTVLWDGNRATQDNRAFGEGIAFLSELDTPGFLDLEALRCTLGGTTSLIGLLRDRPGTVVARREGPLFVISTPTVMGKFYNYAPFGYRVWLNSERSFLPEKIEFLYPRFFEPESKGDWLNRVVEINHKEVLPGVWVPVSAISLGYPPIVDRGTPPLVATVATVAVDLEKSRFNVDLPAAAFRLDEPVDPQMVEEAEVSFAARIRREAESRMAVAFEQARQGHQRILLVLGPFRAKSTAALYEMLLANPDEELAPHMATFRPVRFKLTHPEEARYLTQVLKFDPNEFGTPAIAIFSEDGKLLAQRSNLVVGDPPELKTRLIREFLKSHSTRASDAGPRPPADAPPK